MFDPAQFTFLLASIVKDDLPTGKDKSVPCDCDSDAINVNKIVFEDFNII